MSSFVAFESRRISLVEHSRSNFTFVSISCVQVRILLLPVILMRTANGKSRPMRAEFRTGTRRLTEVEEGILL
jgi:hypothetical protein